jgi:hypothetical protein
LPAVSNMTKIAIALSRISACGFTSSFAMSHASTRSCSSPANPDPPKCNNHFGSYVEC